MGLTTANDTLKIRYKIQVDKFESTILFTELLKCRSKCKKYQNLKNRIY